jgi:hypothetical protein
VKEPQDLSLDDPYPTAEDPRVLALVSFVLARDAKRYRDNFLGKKPGWRHRNELPPPSTR